jgi:hypothetical protein
LFVLSSVSAETTSHSKAAAAHCNDGPSVLLDTGVLLQQLLLGDHLLLVLLRRWLSGEELNFDIFF